MVCEWFESCLTAFLTVQIVEIQFLLDFLLKAKKMGHKFYNVWRRQQFIDSVTHSVYNVNENYEKYKNKIVGLVKDHNINQFARQLFVKPNIVASLIDKYDIYNNDGLLLRSIAYVEDRKMFRLFLDHIFYFSDMILGDKNDSFKEKYLNLECWETNRMEFVTCSL